MRLASALEAAGERFMDQGLAAATGAARAVAVDEFFAPDPGAAVETSRGLFVVLEDYQQRAMLLAGEAGGVAGARAVERALYLSANAGEKVGPALHGAAMDDARGAAEGMRGVADGAMVAGLVAALGVVPAFMGAVALMVASLNRARASLFSMFFSVPRPVVVALATQDVKVEGVEADEAAKMEETHWEHANLTDADRKVARDIAQGSRAALSGLRLDVTSRRAQAHSARQIALLLLPLLLLAAFVLSLQLGAYAVACGALRPAASLLAVSRCRALVLSVAHYAAAAAVGEATPERLVEEADVLEDLWESVLYGTDTEHPQIGAGLAMPGSLQSDSALSRVLFSEDCLRDPASGARLAARRVSTRLSPLVCGCKAICPHPPTV